MESTGAAPVCGAGDVAAPRTSANFRARLAVVLLLLGCVAFAASLAAGDAFLPRSWVRVGTFTILLPIPSGQPPKRFFAASGDEVLISSTGNSITIRGNASISFTGSPLAPSSLTDLAFAEPGWGAAVLALLATVPLFWWWRRGGLSFGRVAGVATCVVAGAAVCVLVVAGSDDYTLVAYGEWWTLPLAASLMAAAFVVAPAPVRRIE